MATKPLKKHVPAPAPAAEPTQQTQTITPAKPAARELTDFQLKAANLASDLLMNGGHSSDIHGLIAVLIAHQMRMQFRSISGPDKIEEWIERDSDKWLRSLSRFWPETKPEPDLPLPTTVSQEAREDLRGTIRVHVRDFLASGKMHELHFLCNVLETFGSTVTRGAGDADDDDCALLEAVMYELGRTGQYIHVQKEHVELVRGYVELLTSAGELKGDS